MKKIKFLVCTLLASAFVFAWIPGKIRAEETQGQQAAEEAWGKKSNPPATLVNMKKDTSLSGYGAFYSRYSPKVGETEGWFMGGRGAVIINDHFTFGGGGMGLVTRRDRGNLSGNEYTGLNDTANFGYGGFLAEYYINPKSLVVFSFGTLIGGGQLSFSRDGDDDDDDDDHFEKDKFFVVEPEANVFVNITRFCRLGVGASYRYISGLDHKDFDSNDFSGPAVSAMIQFGWF